MSLDQIVGVPHQSTRHISDYLQYPQDLSYLYPDCYPCMPLIFPDMDPDFIRCSLDLPQDYNRCSGELPDMDPALTETVLDLYRDYNVPSTWHQNLWVLNKGSKLDTASNERSRDSTTRQDIATRNDGQALNCMRPLLQTISQLSRPENVVLTRSEIEPGAGNNDDHQQNTPDLGCIDIGGYFHVGAVSSTFAPRLNSVNCPGSLDDGSHCVSPAISSVHSPGSNFSDGLVSVVTSMWQSPGSHFNNGSDSTVTSPLQSPGSHFRDGSGSTVTSPLQSPGSHFHDGSGSTVTSPLQSPGSHFSDGNDSTVTSPWQSPGSSISDDSGSTITSPWQSPGSHFSDGSGSTVTSPFPSSSSPLLADGNADYIASESSSSKSSKSCSSCPDKKKNEKQRNKTKKTRKPRNQKQLWQFLLEILDSPQYNPSHIEWVDEQQGIFHFVLSQKVAQLWGMRRNKTDLSYEYFSRAMRYYYARGIMKRIEGRKLVYQFLKRSAEQNENSRST